MFFEGIFLQPSAMEWVSAICVWVSAIWVSAIWVSAIWVSAIWVWVSAICVFLRLVSAICVFLRLVSAICVFPENRPAGGSI